MLQNRLADIDHDAFEWPEPLVIDLLCEHYRGWTDTRECLVLAKMQQRMLRDLFEGDSRRFMALREELAIYAESLGIGAELVERADRIVFWDLIKVVKVRFRTSTRSRVASARRLHDALGRLAEDTVPVATPSYVRPKPWTGFAPRASLAGAI